MRCLLKAPLEKLKGVRDQLAINIDRAIACARHLSYSIRQKGFTVDHSVTCKSKWSSLTALSICRSLSWRLLSPFHNHNNDNWSAAQSQSFECSSKARINVISSLRPRHLRDRMATESIKAVKRWKRRKLSCEPEPCQSLRTLLPRRQPTETLISCCSRWLATERWTERLKDDVCSSWTCFGLSRLTKTIHWG